LVFQIFQVWLDDRKRDWCTKQERQVENEPQKLTYNVKDRLLNEISILTAKKTRSNEFHERKQKGDLTRRKDRGLMIDFTVDAINEIETFCYSIILVEHWRHSFHITSGAIIALESFAFESMQAIFDCIAVKKRKRFHITSGAIISLESFASESIQAIFDCIAVKKIKRSSRVKANVHVKRSISEQRRKRTFESNVTTKRKRQCR
jgi:predicted dinucleotide-utilizing enzyme